MKPQTKKKPTQALAAPVGRAAQPSSGKQAGGSGAAPGMAMPPSASTQGPINPNKTGGPS